MNDKTKTNIINLIISVIVIVIILMLASCSMLPSGFAPNINSKSVSGGGKGNIAGEISASLNTGDSKHFNRSNIDNNSTNVSSSTDTSKSVVAGVSNDKSINDNKVLNKTETGTTEHTYGNIKGNVEIGISAEKTLIIVVGAMLIVMFIIMFAFYIGGKVALIRERRSRKLNARLRKEIINDYLSSGGSSK